MEKILIQKKDEIVLKILHYFITEEDYKPIILTGVENEIWLENLNKDLKLIRININYIHNNEQYESDLRKANFIMRNIKRKTLSFTMNMLNILIDTGENVNLMDAKNIESVKIEKASDFKKNKTVKRFFPKIKDKFSGEKAEPYEFIKLTEEMNAKTKKDEKKLKRIFENKKPIVTYAIMSLCITIYVMMEYFGFYNLFMYAGANNDVLVKGGGIYRLFTSMFLHANLYHILFNMYALYIIGPQVERYFGRLKFLVIYLISGLLGSLFSCVFMSYANLSVGASGAIFGLFGSLAFFSYKYRATLNEFLRSSILPTIFINLILGFLLPNVDVSAHIGGIVGGILTAIIIATNDKRNKSAQINSLIVLILIFVFLSYILLIK